MSCDMLYYSHVTCYSHPCSAGSDYTSTVMELVFSAVVRRHVVRVSIINDSFSEINERFRASLTLVEKNGINVLINPALAIVTIVDDDGEVDWVALFVSHINTIRIPVSS